MKILIVKTSAIGDVLHTLPALAVLKKKYPTAQISWLVEEAAAPVVLGHPDLHQVIVSPRKQWIKNVKEGHWLRTGREFMAFIQHLRKVKYDLLIDFQGLLKSSLLIACCRAQRKVGFGRGMAHAEGSYLFLTERVPPVDMDIHAVDRELLLLEGLGISSDTVDISLSVAAEKCKAATELLVAAGADLDRPVIAINPMTTWPSKHWTSSGFADLAEVLAKRGLTVVFTGGPGDHGPIQEILAGLQPGLVISIAGQTDLMTLAAVYRLARLVISTDTGPMHLAASVHTPVVALFGPTAPWRTGPYGNIHKVVRKDLACSPCLKRDCRFGSTECMHAISVDDVLAAVDELGLGKTTTVKQRL